MKTRRIDCGVVWADDQTEQPGSVLLVVVAQSYKATAFVSCHTFVSSTIPTSEPRNFSQFKTRRIDCGVVWADDQTERVAWGRFAKPQSVLVCYFVAHCLSGGPKTVLTNTLERILHPQYFRLYCTSIIH